jgi:hypothetical protein
MSITRNHVISAYGPLVNGPKLSAAGRDAVAHELSQILNELSFAAARILAHHMHRAALANPEADAEDAITVLSEDFGIVPVTEAIGGGKLHEWIKRVWKNRHKYLPKGRDVLDVVKRGAEAFEAVQGDREGRRKALEEEELKREAQREDLEAERIKRDSRQLALELAKLGLDEKREKLEAERAKRAAKKESGGGMLGGSPMGGAMLGGGMLGGAMLGGGQMGGAMLGGARMPAGAYRDARRMTLAEALRGAKR